MISSARVLLFSQGISTHVPPSLEISYARTKSFLGLLQLLPLPRVEFVNSSQQFQVPKESCTFFMGESAAGIKQIKSGVFF